MLGSEKRDQAPRLEGYIAEKRDVTCEVRMYVCNLLVLLSVVVGLGHSFIYGVPILKALLLWLLVIKVGGGRYVGSGHCFTADRVAAYIGWPAGNPSQRK
jgi:hypothetical protein